MLLQHDDSTINIVLVLLLLLLLLDKRTIKPRFNCLRQKVQKNHPTKSTQAKRISTLSQSSNGWEVEIGQIVHLSAVSRGSPRLRLEAGSDVRCGERCPGSGDPRDPPIWALITTYQGWSHRVVNLSWWCSGLSVGLSKFPSNGRGFDSRLGRNQVNSAFRPSGVGQSSISLHRLGLRQGVLAYVGLQVKLCDTIYFGDSP